MQRMIRINVTYGFLILALGLMLTDVCKLVRTPSEPALSAATTTRHVHRF